MFSELGGKYGWHCLVSTLFTDKTCVCGLGGKEGIVPDFDCLPGVLISIIDDVELFGGSKTPEAVVRPNSPEKLAVTDTLLTENPPQAMETGTHRYLAAHMFQS